MQLQDVDQRIVVTAHFLLDHRLHDKEAIGAMVASQIRYQRRDKVEHIPRDKETHSITAQIQLMDYLAMLLPTDYLEGEADPR
jgi:hypothetical protein